MRIINDQDLLKYYLKKYNIPSFFTNFNIRDFELQQFSKNEYVYNSGKKIEYLYFLVDGSANIFTNLKDGKQILISYLRPFYVIGEVELHRYDITRFDIVSMEKSILIALPYRIIKEKYLKDYKFWKFTSNSIAEKLEATSEFLLIGMLYPLEIRIANFFYNSMNKEEKVYYSSLTSLASMFGVSYRQLLRVIKKFRQDGVIEKEDDYFLIKKPEKIEELVVDV